MRGGYVTVTATQHGLDVPALVIAVLVGGGLLAVYLRWLLRMRAGVRSRIARNPPANDPASLRRRWLRLGVLLVLGLVALALALDALIASKGGKVPRWDAITIGVLFYAIVVVLLVGFARRQWRKHRPPHRSG